MTIHRQAAWALQALFALTLTVQPDAALAGKDDPDANTEDSPSLGQSQQSQGQGKATSADKQQSATGNSSHQPNQNAQQNRATRPERPMRHERPPRPERFHK